MTLHAIVAALGGDLHQGGCRANVPAPGHSAADRSMSLMLSEGRLIIHGFGGVEWRAMRDDLRRRGLIDSEGVLTGSGRSGPSVSKPDHAIRRATAARLWDDTVAIDEATASQRHLRLRAVRCGGALNLRHHPQVPVSVYRPDGRRRAALVARISDASDRLTAIELTYLEPSGRLASGLRLTRKTVGLVPPGAAVRLAPANEEMLVGEGVITTLSAMDRFGLPGWALRAANNLAAWSPPPGVRRVLIAADRGAVGQVAADRLRFRLLRIGVQAEAIWPEPPYGDWNEVATASQREKGGR